jgi:hypothetical protein
MLAANPIDHHARDRVDAVLSAAALRTPARTTCGCPGRAELTSAFPRSAARSAKTFAKFRAIT